MHGVLTKEQPMKLETIAVHAGKTPDPGSGAITSSIQLATTFERGADGTFSHGYIYARSNNPNRKALETCLAALEGGACAAAFASGSAASMAVFQALSPGDHIIAPLDIYWGTTIQLREILERWGLKVSTVDMSDARQVEEAMTPRTRLLWVETPSNPLLKIVDIARMVAIGRSAGAIVACDNTWGTPVLQRPLEMGVDVVMHSTTKYLGGHSDVISGALISKEEDDFFRKMRLIQTSGGAVPSPFDCWLIQRGVSTLAWRVRAQSQQAFQVAEFLNQHPNVAAVHYPGLPNHPGHEVAKRQMKFFGGMLAFQVRAGREAAMAVAAKVKIFTRATSLGGVESLIEHRASIEHPGTRTPDDLLRVSIGLEHVDDLIEDLNQALR
jgi:cystathionine gamma-synthase